MLKLSSSSFNFVFNPLHDDRHCRPNVCGSRHLLRENYSRARAPNGVRIMRLRFGGRARGERRHRAPTDKDLCVRA
jgi:hypothetical protein